MYLYIPFIPYLKRILTFQFCNTKFTSLIQKKIKIVFICRSPSLKCCKHHDDKCTRNISSETVNLHTDVVFLQTFKELFVYGVMQ